MQLLFGANFRPHHQQQKQQSNDFIIKIGQIILRERVWGGAAEQHHQLQPTKEEAAGSSNEEFQQPELLSFQPRSRTKSDILFKNNGGGGGGSSGSSSSSMKGFGSHSRVKSDPGNKNGPFYSSNSVWGKNVELNMTLNSEFWNGNVPLHFDVRSAAQGGLLLERWVISLQSPQPSVVAAPSFIRDGDVQFYRGDNEDAQMQSRRASIGDTTDLILLAQSIYSEIRGLPLSNSVMENSVSKDDLRYSVFLANGEIVEHNSTCITSLDTTSNASFHPQAQLSALKFREACGPQGTLLVKVIYDANLTALTAGSQPFSNRPPSIITAIQSSIAQISLTRPSPSSHYTNTLLVRESDVGSIISSGTFQLRTTPQTIPEEEAEELAQQSNGEDDTFNTNNTTNTPNENDTYPDIPNRKMNSSPFPSPQMQKRVLSIVKSRMDRSRDSRSAPYPNNAVSPTKVRSGLQFDLSNLASDSSSSLDSDGIEISDSASTDQAEVEQLESLILSADGIVIAKALPRPIINTPSPSIPFSNSSRRDSASSEPFGSFVGSYEESILIGRMSTTPSKPVPFLAEIGVLAIGKCKPSLKCPPHASISFSAYFYQLPEEDVPTPYVGTIDLSNSSSSFYKANQSSNDLCLGYRLPNKGQLQIMIKNPSCTAIKVFLIPYDFRDMPQNAKTFIRQKSYASTCSICPLTGKKSSGKERLKFAIHLNFQMSAKKQLYLSSHFRVVFSPRPLETDENVRIAYQVPTPKYSIIDFSTGGGGVNDLLMGSTPPSHHQQQSSFTTSGR